MGISQVERARRMTRLRPTEIGLAIASMALLVMLLHVAIAVIGRNVLSLEPSGMIEMVSNWWMITIFFLGLASSYVRGDQIRISALVDGAGPRSKAIGNRAIAVLSASALVVLTYYSGRAGLASMLIQERTFGVVALPVWPFKLLIPIGFLLSLGCVLRDLIFGTWDGPMPADNAKTNHAVFNILLLAVWAAALVVGVVMLTFSLSNLAIGILGIVLMLALMMMGVPVAISMIAAGLLGILKIAGLGAFEATIMRAPFGAAASWSLSVLPMFILMGLIMWRSGFTARVFDIFQRLFGFLPGGLVVTTNFAGAALASASGSSAAISYALGRIAIPEMLKRGYQPSLATGVVVMAGVIGNLIPPSIVLIVYAGVAQTPIGPQLLAAVIPGIMISCSYGALIIIRCKLNPALAPRGEVVPTSWGTKLRLVSQLWGLPLIIALVLGSIYSGWATATEAGALGALGAAFVGYLEVRNRIAFGLGVKEALMEAVSSFSAIMFLFIGVAVLTRMIALSGVALFISEGVIGMNLPPLQLIFLLMVVYLILGTFLDTMAIILLTVPLFTATLAAAQIDMLWFGVFVTIMAELAVVTPPLGVLAFIVYRMAQKPEVNMGKTISLTDVFIGCSWFLGATLLCIVALIMFPGLALWLPGKGGHGPWQSSGFFHGNIACFPLNELLKGMKMANHGFTLQSVRNSLLASVAMTLISVSPSLADDITLRFTSFEPEGITGFQANRFGDEITERSNGEIKMEYYWAGSLLPAAEMASGIASGVADIGMILPPYNPSEFPIANWATALGALVDTPYPYSTLQGAAANAEALLANKDVLAEFERQGLVILTPLFAYPNYDLLCAMPVTTLEEAKGKRVRVGGNLWAGQAQAVGMEPVALPGSDVYQAAQRGVVDCVMQYPAGFVGNSVWDVIKDYTPVQFTGWNAMYLVMGRDKWLSLTESQQKAVLDSAVTYFVLTHKKSLKDYAVFAGPEADTHGVVFHTPDPAFFDAIKAAQAASLSNAVANAPDTLADAAGFEDQYRQAMAKWGEIVMKDAPGAGAANDAAIDTRAALLSGAELDLTNWGEQVRHEVFDNYRP